MLLQGIPPARVSRRAPLRSELKEFGSCDGLATDVEDFRHLGWPSLGGWLVLVYTQQRGVGK